MEEKKEISELDAMEALAAVVNDTPIEIFVGGEKYKVTSLKMGTQVLISEEVCRIQRGEEMNMSDVIKQFATNMPSVVHCLALAILNDKDKLFKDYQTKEYSKEYKVLCERIMWESDKGQWIGWLIAILQKLSLDFFFQTTTSLMAMKEMMLTKKNHGQK